MCFCSTGDFASTYSRGPLPRDERTTPPGSYKYGGCELINENRIPINAYSTKPSMPQGISRNYSKAPRGSATFIGDDIQGRACMSFLSPSLSSTLASSEPLAETLLQAAINGELVLKQQEVAQQGLKVWRLEKIDSGLKTTRGTSDDGADARQREGCSRESSLVSRLRIISLRRDCMLYSPHPQTARRAGGRRLKSQGILLNAAREVQTAAKRDSALAEAHSWQMRRLRQRVFEVLITEASRDKMALL
ncbi:hypothetical protein Tco_0765285 [Tanacetum coccineum]